jgi:ankyrin repeat protein
VQLAAFADHPAVVRRLVAGKSEIPDVFTAATVGDARLGELLKGSDESAKARNGRGLTPLHVAVREGHEAAVRALLAAGAEVNAIDAPELQHPYRWNALHLAVFTSRTGAAKLLIDKGADACAGDAWGVTPLHYAAANGEVELVKAMLAARFDRAVTDKRGRTPLDLAREGKHAEVIKLLEDPK